MVSFADRPVRGGRASGGAGDLTKRGCPAGARSHYYYSVRSRRDLMNLARQFTGGTESAQIFRLPFSHPRRVPPRPSAAGGRGEGVRPRTGEFSRFRNPPVNWRATVR
jgi:hypothetical protein